MRRFLVVTAVLGLFLPTQAFGQSSAATVSGTVSDATGALIPGVTVTAANNATGVVTTVISNEAGVYNFASLLPGVYLVKAELSGFQTQTYTDVQLGNAAQVRLNFRLQVAAVAQAVEVTIAADTLLATSSSSVGSVLAEQRVRDLPIVGNNVLDLIATMGGVRIPNPDAVFGADSTTFAGVSASNVNVQRDGVTVNAGGRYPTGIQAATRMNPDLVGEVRLILAPVDAETGRGNGQIQIQTRSGTNEFHGNAVWYVRNTALDANTWNNNRTQPVPPPRDWRNFQQYTLSAGGPIVRNKTFFFVLWDGVVARTRSTVSAIVLTDCARRGIFRYYDNWNNGHATSSTQPAGATPTTAVVDALGNPLAPAVNPNGTAHNGILRYASVFGQLQNIPTRPDCSDAIVTGAPWDVNRRGLDPTGYVAKVLQLMPLANNFDGNSPNVASGGGPANTLDGLNTASHRWTRGLRGSNNLWSIGEEQDRNQINLKIDHQFNATHKINGAWSYERASSDDAYQTWPNGWGGSHFSRPMVVTANFTSTLSPNTVNEARFGMRRTGSNPISPIETPGSGEQIRKFIFEVAGIPVWPHLGTGAVNFQNSQPPGGRGAFQITQRDVTPLWSYADTLSWTKGKHTYKFGGEIRFARSKGYQNGLGFGATDAIHGRAIGGDTTLAPISATAISNTTPFVAGLAGNNGLAGTTISGNNQRMRNLLSYLAGSLSSINQAYFIDSASRLNDWENYTTLQYVTRDFHQNEFAAFFKDDWKVDKNLTINLGVRYEYFGVPFEAKGLTASLVGGGSALFGISGRDYDGWMRPGRRAELTALEFVGPNSPNPNKRIFKNDWNNIGPAVGFAWQVPWFGEGKTTVRGGYQITYQGAIRGGELQTAIGFPPGSVFRAQNFGFTGNEYLDLTDLRAVFPVAPVANGVPIRPMQPIAITDRLQTIQAFDPNLKTPYVQNFTLSVTRNLRQNLIVDLKYIGTTALKQYQNINLNVPNFLYNGLQEAFDAVRSGGESALLDQMFRGVQIATSGCQTPQGAATPCGLVGTTVNGVLQTAGMHMRADTRFNSNLANGNYPALASTLNTLNYSKAGGLNAALPNIPAGVQGAVLRHNGFPENFIATNPQFSGATYRTNTGRSNYHSMEAHVMLRPTNGIALDAYYTWSRGLGTMPPAVAGAAGYTNPVDRAADYTLTASHRKHDFRMNGSFELPFGPGRLLLANSSGFLARLVENWQMSWLMNLNSGAPMSITAQNMLYASGVADVVGPFDRKSGKVQWGGVRTAAGQVIGSYFDPTAYVTLDDPQCARIAPNLRRLCTIDAVADAKTGQIIFQNPLPGTIGNSGLNILEGPGQWRFDASVSKRFRIGESKSVQVRIDAYNVLNHPEPQAPNLQINNPTTTPFGGIATKTLTVGFVTAGASQRMFQAQLRINF